MPIGQRTRDAIVGALVGLALFIVVFSLSDLEMGVGRATLYPHHLVAAGVIVLLSVYLFSRRRRSKFSDECEPGVPQPAPSSNDTPSLALVAFIAGPILTLAVGLIAVTFLNVHPMDRASVICSMVTLGFIVGTLVAVVLAAAGKIR
jgi:hypothetical protein